MGYMKLDKILESQCVAQIRSFRKISNYNCHTATRSE